MNSKQACELTCKLDVLSTIWPDWPVNLKSPKNLNLVSFEAVALAGVHHDDLISWLAMDYTIVM